MKTSIIIKSFTLLFAVLFYSNSLTAQQAKRQYYQLKTYTLKDEAQESRMDAYLKDAFLPALKKAGIKDVGVFKFRPNNYLIADKIFVLIPFNDLGEFEGLDSKLANDPTYQKAGTDYINAAFDNPPYQRINSVLMRAFAEMPKMEASKLTGPRKDRVYELRSYESPTEATYLNKVDMFNAGGEVELFESLDFNAVFYAEVISGDSMPNLMYMTTFPDMKTRDAKWEAFFGSDKWGVLKNEPKYQNNMNKADKLLLYPTEYSDY
ncbi:NIPSNAP family containing protein [Euzebyella marina]|uniref:NIPSNAP family containing protein n=1 Tax=Euzebyella marina TaxID=1761453 RepID=A0A3G2L9J5_9FLAO|nr:NIPSNAP family protein [Euzebyella marina]AYN68871.1 NIPSNAP family containing protein [Euzebyella marina]